MRRVRILFVMFFMAAALMLFSMNTVSADGPVGLSTAPEAVAPFGQQPIVRDGLITITQSAVQDVVQGNSVSCNAGGLHTDNSYFRRFDLADDFGITGEFSVTNVEFGIEQAIGAGGSQPVTVRLWSIDDGASFVLANVSLVSEENFDVPDQALTIYSADITGVIDAGAGDELVVEVFTPEGQTAGNSFFIGSNPFGQTAPSYLLAADCGVTEPTDTAALGFPDMHIVMNVIGDEGGPTAVTLDNMSSSEGSSLPLAGIALLALGLTAGAMVARRRVNG